jgi:hypothetical protein
MRGFLQLEITFVLLSTFIFICSCSTNTKEQPDANKDNRSSSANSAVVDSSIFLKGEAIFRIDCNKCHVSKGRLHNYLEGVVQRSGVDYLKLYLTKQDSLIAAKNSNALMLKRVWNNQGNSHNFIYTEEELNSIIEYLK